MVSFLIPIYNRDVRSFIDTLYDQCIKQDIEFEILCYDDFSREEFKVLNRKLSEKVGISYMELSKNLGRSRIRNWLGKNARYENLIFMDCDSMIPSPDFVNNYLEVLDKADIVYGGTEYQSIKPAEDLRLHWKYGKKVEAASVSSRRKDPYRSFRSNNFSIKRFVFLENKFDETVEGYGYEDILLGESLRKNGYTMFHIDNPLIHDGLETSDSFLQKTENAINNLVKMYCEGSMKTRLTDRYDWLVDQRLVLFYQKISNSIFPNKKERLHKANPSIFIFQLFKLDLFIAKIQALQLDK